MIYFREEGGNAIKAVFMIFFVVSIAGLTSCSKSSDLCAASLVAINRTDRVVTAYRVLAENEDYRTWRYADQYVTPGNEGDGEKEATSCLYTPELNGPSKLYPGAKLVVQWQVESLAGFERKGDDDWYRAVVEVPKNIPEGYMTLNVSFLSDDRVRIQVRSRSKESRQILGEYDGAVVQGWREAGHKEPNFSRHTY
ncbi:DUF3304 domain-containing protein [Burkholderia lata]|uniref:DUF3304 domain-containing protein n=1 Tax=Burkholderia lata (strain ATCC 17760 / DSM 23089 / LMG 22485 / NCIMB 9086 / R18194 / 383) TaxID=482957 RepID=UPI0015823BE5|nr:DUF3304 domain-containing protein [Burkholderia lata]